MKARSLKALAVTTVLAFTLAGCSSDEAAGGHGTPESVRLFDTATNTELPQPYSLPSGTTTRVTVHFYDADGDDISAAMVADHFTSLAFAPSTFATSADVAGENFQEDVTVAAAAGAASELTVGWGHDELADEMSFGPYPVTASDGAATARNP